MNTKTPRVTLKVIAEHCGYSVNKKDKPEHEHFVASSSE